MAKNTLNIYDLEIGKNAIIHVKIGEKELDIPTTCMAVKDSCLLVRAIEIDGKLLSFNKAKCEVSLIYPMEPMPIIFDDIEIDVVGYKGKKYHRVASNSKGKTLNRRENYRVYVGEDCQIKLGGRFINGVIKDLSLTGFSFVLTEEAKFATSFVSLQFSDESKQIILKGNIIRSERTDNGKFLYGCKINTTPNGLDRYINMKQQKEIRKLTK